MPTVNFEVTGRRGTVLAVDSGGTSYNAFSGLVTASKDIENNNDWNDLINGTQSLVSGTVTALKLSTTTQVYPSAGE